MNKAICFVILMILSSHTSAEISIISNEYVHLRSKPSFNSREGIRLKYGMKVRILDRDKDWIEVQFNQIIGWLHESSLTSDKKKVKGIGKKVTLSEKGFSRTQETYLKSKIKTFNYVDVEKILAFKTNIKELKNFIQYGKLHRQQ